MRILYVDYMQFLWLIVNQGGDDKWKKKKIGPS